GAAGTADTLGGSAAGGAGDACWTGTGRGAAGVGVVTAGRWGGECASCAKATGFGEVGTGWTGSGFGGSSFGGSTLGWSAAAASSTGSGSSKAGRGAWTRTAPLGFL